MWIIYGEEQKNSGNLVKIYFSSCNCEITFVTQSQILVCWDLNMCQSLNYNENAPPRYHKIAWLNSN